MVSIYREINIEAGLPYVDEALARLNRELLVCKKSGIRIIKIVHGYGSTGKGGIIREECRKELQKRLKNGSIKRIVYGEDFRLLNKDAYDLKCKCVELNTLFRMNNKGVTVIEI